MMKTLRGLRVLLVLALLALPTVAPSAAYAGPRSGGSFGGRLGFRQGGGLGSPGYSGGGYAPSYGGGYSTGPHFLFFPSFGGYGFGGGFGLAPILGILVIGLVVAQIARAARANRAGGGGRALWGGGDDDQPSIEPGQAYLYKLQLALGRSARGIQDRLAEFAAQGDTSTEAGLAALLQQTALELLREKDAVRYASVEGRGPMTLTNAETAMNGVSLAERGRFQVERVRSADGRVLRSATTAEEGREALELVVVTILAATRAPLPGFGAAASPDDVAAGLGALGSVPADDLLGVEVIWTPADPDDSMTETDVMTTYPDLRSV
jgi:uncharacterized membrane protein